MEPLAEQIARKIIEDLSGRKGIGDEWNQMDKDTQKEVLKSWAEIIDPYLNCVFP